MAAPSSSSPAAATQPYFDEEECVGFQVFVAELELVLGTSRDRAHPDQVQLFELLQKLHASIGRSEPAAIKGSQKRCEAALVDVLAKGVGAAVSCARGECARF